MSVNIEEAKENISTLRRSGRVNSASLEVNEITGVRTKKRKETSRITLILRFIYSIIHFNQALRKEALINVFDCEYDKHRFSLKLVRL